MGDVGNSSYTSNLPVGQQRIACMHMPTLSERIVEYTMRNGRFLINREDGIPYFAVDRGSEIGPWRLQIHYVMPDQAIHMAHDQNSRMPKSRELGIRLINEGYTFHGFGGNMNDSASYAASISPNCTDFAALLPKEDRQKVYKQLLKDVAQTLGIES